ncbi:MAG: sigma-70 family RNA polymerase sigma factor [Kiritimatiellae bacterium]|nr:sigma-70 family RNA polymerase sigma factor [Kiritimatiellia bacterium]
MDGSAKNPANAPLPSPGERAPFLPAEEAALLARARAGETEAAERLQIAYYPLVLRIVREDFSRAAARLGLSVEDLYSAGVRGIVDAIAHFNPGRGTPFFTYAPAWIKKRVRDSLNEQGHLVRLPARLVGEILELSRTADILSQTLGREPTPAELADATGKPRRRVARLKRLAERPVSLDKPPDDGGPGDGEEYNALPDTPDPPPFPQEMVEELVSLLPTLPDNRRAVVTLYHGLDGKGERSFEEIGRLLGTSRETARTLYNKARADLKSRMDRPL